MKRPEHSSAAGGPSRESSVHPPHPSSSTPISNSTIRAELEAARQRVRPLMEQALKVERLTSKVLQLRLK